MNDITAEGSTRRKAERQAHDPNPVEVGTWVWVLPKEQPDEREDEDGNTRYSSRDPVEEWLGCVVHVGSNFAKVKGPMGQARRIHLERFDSETRPEPNARAVIERHVNQGRENVGKLLEEVKAITARLGVSPVATPSPGDENYALASLSSTADVKSYEKALEKAKKEELPALFEAIKEENETLALWMSAELLPLKATAQRAKVAVDYVEDRIFNVSLYAGLTENVVQFAKGKPAAPDAKLHVFQARLYMDEESLLGYEHGGLEFDDIGKFDAWMAKPANRDRLLPYPRSLVAMRVRRNAKERHADSLLTAWINFDLEQLDKTTFFYMRNGERLYRMNCDEQFGALIFPSKDEFLNEPSMARVSNDEVKGFMTVREYESILTKEAAQRVEAAKWAEEHPFEEWSKKQLAEDRAKFAAKAGKIQAEYAERVREAQETAARRRAGKERFFVKWSKKDERGSSYGIHSDEEGVTAEEREQAITKSLEKSINSAAEKKRDALNWAKRDYKGRRAWSKRKHSWEDANPHHSNHSIADDGWEPFDQTSVYFDEARKEIHDQVKSWNRIALIIQGLYDRSEIFHPHPPVSLATPRGFAEAIELVYDGTFVLEPGPAPDFEAYRRAGLEKLDGNSVTIGQKSAWLDREREAEERRRDGSDRRVSPSNDPGPGYVARVAKWNPKTRQATFRWLRGRRRGYDEAYTIKASIAVDADDLFNVSAYVPGDYRRFYEDPRTRRQYLRWAPLLLTAEEWHAKNPKVRAREPDAAPDEKGWSGDHAVAFDKPKGAAEADEDEGDEEDEDE